MKGFAFFQILFKKFMLKSLRSIKIRDCSNDKFFNFRKPLPLPLRPELIIENSIIGAPALILPSASVLRINRRFYISIFAEKLRS